MCLNFDQVWKAAWSRPFQVWCKGNELDLHGKRHAVQQQLEGLQAGNREWETRSRRVKGRGCYFQRWFLVWKSIYIHQKAHSNDTILHIYIYVYVLRYIISIYILYVYQSLHIYIYTYGFAIAPHLKARTLAQIAWMAADIPSRLSHQCGGMAKLARSA